MKPNINWLFCLDLKYVHLCSPEEFMFRAFNMVPEPRAGRCCLMKTEEVLELFIGLHNIWIVTWQCRHDSSSLNYHCTPPAAYQSPLLPMLSMDPTGWISIKLRTVMWHNLKMLHNKSKKKGMCSFASNRSKCMKKSKRHFILMLQIKCKSALWGWDMGTPEAQRRV